MGLMWGFPTFFFQPRMSIDDLIDPVRQQLAELGFELVDLRRSGSTQHGRRPPPPIRASIGESRSVPDSIGEASGAVSRVGPQYRRRKTASGNGQERARTLSKQVLQ